MKSMTSRSRLVNVPRLHRLRARSFRGPRKGSRDSHLATSRQHARHLELHRTSKVLSSFHSGLQLRDCPAHRLPQKGDFYWTEAAEQAFKRVKALITQAPILRLPDIGKVFECACDASGVGIGGVLSQEGHPIEYFSESLNDVRLRYSTYDREFYAVIQALKHW